CQSRSRCEPNSARDAQYDVKAEPFRHRVSLIFIRPRQFETPSREVDSLPIIARDSTLPCSESPAQMVSNISRGIPISRTSSIVVAIKLRLPERSIPTPASFRAKPSRLLDTTINDPVRKTPIPTTDRCQSSAKN